MSRKKGRKRRPPTHNRQFPPERPSVPEALAANTDTNKARLRLRGEAGDGFAALLADAYSTEVHDEGVMQTGTLTADEHAELLRLAPEMEREYSAELAAMTERVVGIAKDANPIGLLVNMILANVIGIEGEYFEPTHQGSETHVEYAAALLASIKRDEDDLPPPSYEHVVDFVETINEIFFVARLANLARHIRLSEAGDTTAEISFLAQARHLSVRGDCYPQHGIRLALDLYEPFKDAMRSGLGFDIAEAIALADGAVDLMERKLNNFLDDVPPQAETLADATDPDPGHTRAEMLQAAIAFSVHEGITAALTFTAAELADAIQVPPRAAGAFLAEMSTPLADGDGKVPTPFGSHETAKRPIVRYEDRYTVAVPGRLARELAVLLDARVSAITKGLDKHKDRVVSNTATQLISGMLDNAPSHTHLFYEWAEDGKTKRFELDGLVTFGRCLFIIEGKTGHLGASERGTDIKRLRSRIEEHVVDSLQQAQRARSFITSQEEVTFTDKNGAPLVTLRAEHFEHFFLITPTLRLLADLGPQLRRLRSLNLFEDEEYPFSIYVNDLRVISEFIRSPMEFIHYLRWRAELPLGDRIVVVDELDLFVSFLLREQFRRYLAVTDGPIECVGSSADLDDYYLGQRGRNRPKNKPRFYTPVRAVRDFLDRLASGQPEGWLDAGGTCLELSIPELAWLGVALKQIPKDLRDHECVPTRIDSPTEREFLDDTHFSAGVIALGRAVSIEDARLDPRLNVALEGIERVIYASVSRRGNPKILWAVTRQRT